MKIQELQLAISRWNKVAELDGLEKISLHTDVVFMGNKPPVLTIWLKTYSGQELLRVDGETNNLDYIGMELFFAAFIHLLNVKDQFKKV